MHEGNGRVTDEVAQRVLDGRATLPGHMVYRSFVAETVILNLNSGTYHGTSAVGGVMLERLAECEKVRDAARNLAEHFDRPVDEIERDIVDFCLSLQERGLIVLDSSPAR